MKNKRLLCLLLAAVLGLALAGCGKDSLSEEKVRIAVIAKATASDFWHNVFSGVNSAATEYNADVTIEGPDSEEDFAAQNDMIAAAVAGGADAIVFSAIDYYQSVDAVEAAVKAGVKVVVIDSSVDTDKVSLVIGTDNYAAGRMAAEAALSRGRAVSGGGPLYIGLVNYDVNSANGQERERGFRERLREEGDCTVVETVNLASNAEDATAGTLALLDRHPETNVLVGFNEWMTLGVGYAIQERGLAETVAGIGFDSNVVSIGMLETGEMDALIVQNPFAMGYLGIQTACDLVAGKGTGGEQAAATGEGSAAGNSAVDLPTATTIITKDNMFDENSQKTLFKFW